MSDPVKDRAAYIDEVVDAAERGTTSDNANKSLQERDSGEAPKEQSGMGENNADENKKRLLAQIDKKIEVARAAGNTKLVEKYQADRKRVANAD